MAALAPTNGWRTVALGEVCEIVAKQVDPTDRAYSGLPHISAENIESGTMKLKGVRSAAEDGMMSGKYLFEQGDVLYSKLRPYLRKVAMAPFRGVCSADMYPMRAKDAELDAEFLARLLLTEEFTDYANEASQRARMPKLNREQLFAWQARFPPLAEQRRIAGRLREQMAEVARARAAVQAQLAAAQALPAAVLRAHFTTPAAQRWPRKPFGEVVVNFDGRRIPLKQSDRANRRGAFPYYGASGVIDQIDDFLFDGDFLLIAEDGANLLSRSTPIAFRASGKFWVNNHAHVVQPKPEMRIEVLEHYLEHLDLKRFITGSAQPKLSQGILNEIPILVPSMAEQDALAAGLTAELSAATALRESLAQRLAAIERLPAALLRTAFNPAAQEVCS